MLDWFTEIIGEFGGKIVSYLPQSPIARYLDSIGDLPYLSYLNWFIPVGSILTVCGTWLTCIAIYYLYSIILRWVRAID